jgi:predicted HTH transcriptional regulator
MKLRRRELLELIEEGENLQTEFKLRFSSSEKIAKEIMAFANTSGGIIIFGVDDNRQVVGVQSEKEEAELFRMAAEDFCEPPVLYEIDYFVVDGKELVIASIPESNQKPHRLQDYKDFDINTANVYVRVHDKSVQASKEMIRILRAEHQKNELHKYSIGNVEKAVFTFLENNESITVKQLGDLANISGRRASRSLVTLVRAGVLLIHTKENGVDFFTPKEELPFKNEN